MLLILRIDLQNHFIIKRLIFPSFILTPLFRSSSSWSDSSPFNAPRDNQLFNLAPPPLAWPKLAVQRYLRARINCLWQLTDYLISRLFKGEKRHVWNSILKKKKKPDKLVQTVLLMPPGNTRWTGAVNTSISVYQSTVMILNKLLQKLSG